MKNLMDYFSKLHPEKFFLVSALLFGTLFLFLTPPFQVPDEPNHFYRAWQISEGGLMSLKQDKRVGGYLPASLEKITAPFSNMMWWKNVKIENVPLDDLLKEPLRNDVRKFYDFGNTAMYSPICYFPASTALFFCRLLDTSPMYAFYWARLITLFSWILLVYYALRIIPVFKWVLTLLALLPMSLYINMSINADVVTNAVCFLFFATVLRWAYEASAFNSRGLLNLFLIIFLLASVKNVYIPLLLILLIIPADKFKNTNDRLLKISLLLISGILFSGCWNLLLSPFFVSYENYNPDFRGSAPLVQGADIAQQIDYIRSHASETVSVFLHSFTASFEMYFNGYIGMFGWLENSLPHWFVVTFYFLILLSALCDGDRIHISIKQKMIFAFTFLTIFLLIFLAQFLIWVPVGGGLIQNIQGRYLIPIVPLFWLLFYRRTEKSGKIAAPLTIASVIISLGYCLQVLYSRYH